MTRQRARRVATSAAIALILMLSLACGGDDSTADVGSAPAAPSLESAPSPGEATEAATNTADAPEFPQVQPIETKLTPPADVPEDMKIVWESWQLLLQDFVDPSKLDPEAMSEQAIRGMLTVLGDTQTAYVRPEVLQGDFGDMFRGNFEGIGAHVSMNRAGKVVIIAPIAGSPAEAAGIRSGDIIVEVEGESLEGMSLLEAVALIRGPGGTTVTLLVKHLGALDPILIEVVRGVIVLESVLLRSEPGTAFAHVRLTNFYPNTIDQLREILLKAMEEGAKGLILDLRGNPGGTLDAAVEVASQFLDDGLVLYSISGNGSRTEWTVRKGGIAKDLPMVVLVNEGSASSSEVLAGALQDHNRAQVIGSKSFGKGSVNILRRLSNGGGLYITIAHWFTPLGRLIQDEGIIPDIEVVERDARDADVKQLKRAIEELEILTGVSSSARRGT